MTEPLPNFTPFGRPIRAVPFVRPPSEANTPLTVAEQAARKRGEVILPVLRTPSIPKETTTTIGGLKREDY